MIAGMKSAGVLVLSLVLFGVIVGLLAIGTVMKPGRWSDRPRGAC
ncbi:hypothetical protein ACO9S2_12465 [Nitrospira sp. NS4]